MKTIKYFFGYCLVALLFIGCEQDDNNTDFINTLSPPVNISAAIGVTQDNSGLVTIAPLGEGVVSFVVDFGDGSTVSEIMKPGESIEHSYAEGTYDAIITATGLNGKTTAATKSVVVSFKAPENLLVTIENDATFTKQVNVTATADFATSYEIYFGEPGNDTPVSVNNGETYSYTYGEVGTYTIRVVAKSAAIATTEYSEEFEVTAILQPLTAAPSPSKAQVDVISIYSDVYANPDPINYYPDWGQSTTFAQIEVNGDNIIQYGDLTYQGIDFSTVPVNASEMEFIHIDVWTADSDLVAKLSPISSGPNETAYDLVLLADQWTSFDIPLSFFTDQNPLVDFGDIIQFKLDGVPSGEGTIFIDNLYFYKSSSAGGTGLVGTWKMAYEAGALGVGPSVGDISWFSCDDACVTARACYYDDAYVFGADGSFSNVFGEDTWTEGWQGGGDSCGTPVAPHDGSNPATYVYDEEAGTVTINGVGAFIGLAKANNTGELANPANAPESITYNLTFIDPNTISVYIEAGAGVFWQYKLVREPAVPTPLTGTWKMASEAGALGVGPSVGDISWFGCDDACVTARACYYDNTYVFGSDGSFSNVFGAETWTEGWQGGGDSCGTPVAPHDGSNPATYVYDESSGTITINGVGAFIGLAKANNAGELTNPANAPESIIYNVTFIDNSTISVYVEAGAGVFWQYKLIKI
jgi:hypothetical protein